MFGARGTTLGRIEITLPDALQAWVEESIALGRHASASDYVRGLVRRDQKMCEALVEALIEAERSATSERSVHDIMAVLRSRFDHGQS